MTTSTEAGAARSAWADAPRIDAAAMLWSERKVVLGVGGAICALGLIAGLAAPRSYTAHSELIVRMGEEYVYQPTEDARARNQMLGRAPDNISPVERAAASTQGRSLRWPILIVTSLIAAVVGAAAGFSRALMRRTFPTSSSAARALDAPVLAIIPRAPQTKAPRLAKALRPPAGKPTLTLVEGGA
jgi:uncharacterized protein involved in exopolysaccharide biosynthesis